MMLGEELTPNWWWLTLSSGLRASGDSRALITAGLSRPWPPFSASRRERCTAAYARLQLDAARPFMPEPPAAPPGFMYTGIVTQGGACLGVQGTSIAAQWAMLVLPCGQLAAARAGARNTLPAVATAAAAACPGRPKVTCCSTCSYSLPTHL